MANYTVSWMEKDKVKRERFETKEEAKRFCSEQMKKIKTAVEIYEKKTNRYLFVVHISGGLLQAHAHMKPFYPIPNNAEEFIEGIL